MGARPYRIGLMAVHGAVDYPRTLRMGVESALEEAGHILVVIADMIPYFHNDNAASYLRVAVELVSRLDLDAVIVPLGCLGIYLQGDTQRVLEFVGSMSPERTIIMERELPGFRCVNKDNVPGMRACMRHLIEDRGYTRIAFVSGPEESRGARERESIYFEEMAAHGLEASPSLFGRGPFSGACPEVIERILDENPDLEAIACVCDAIAYTAYKVLRSRKLVVGRDVAVTGFDDHPRSAHLDPPLSTVHMTGFDLGYAAGKEAVRLCAGLPQKKAVVSSEFVPRGSCGEVMRDRVRLFRSLLRRDAFPVERFAEVLVETTVALAGPRIRADFFEHARAFVVTMRESYAQHRAHPREGDSLFSTQDLTLLFSREYREHLSLEGFHATAIAFLEALIEESGEDEAPWIIEQMSHLHLRIARLQASKASEATSLARAREWRTFRMVDDTLRADANPDKAVRLMLQDLVDLGVTHADLFMLPEPTMFLGVRDFALSDKLRYAGSIVDGAVVSWDESSTLVLQELFDRVLPRYGDLSSCILGGIMAGHELMGVAVLRGDTLSDHRQLMALLNLGFAFKHLQILESEREMNRLLQQNNLLLRRQSHHDELTGLLNRRGFQYYLDHALVMRAGQTAALLYMDLDGLKTVNDTYGHDMGDEAIRACASVLSAALSAEALLCRLGGDEFVAFVPLSAHDRVEELEDGLQRAMGDFNEREGKALPFTLSCSVGSATFVVEKGVSERVQELLGQADDKLYEMKRRRKESRRYAP